MKIFKWFKKDKEKIPEKSYMEIINEAKQELKEELEKRDNDEPESNAKY